MHGPKQPVTAAVAGEHATRAIRAVGRRSEAEHDDARVGISEPGNRPPPVRVVPVRGPLLHRDVLAPLHEAWTRPTADHILFEPGERGHGSRQ